MKRTITIFIALICITETLYAQPIRHRYPPPVTFGKNISLKTKPHTLSAVSGDTSSGVVWGPVVKLSLDDPWPSGGNYRPRLVVQGDTVHCIWYGGSYRLPYRRSTNDGLIWETQRELVTDTIISPCLSDWSHIIADSTNIYIFFVFNYCVSGIEAVPVVFIKSSDRGASWSMPTLASADSTGALFSASIFGDSMAVIYGPHINHMAHYPRITRSVDGGINWSKNPFDMPSSSSNQLRVSLTPGLLNFFHPGDRWPGPAPEIVLHRSIDLADTWRDSVVLSPIDGNGSDMPEVAVYEKNNCGTQSATIAVMWRGEEWGGAWFSAGMAVRISHDNGKTWQPFQVVSDVPYGSFHNIAIKDNVVAVTWIHEGSDFAGPFQIKARISLDGGETWKAVANLTPQPTAWATNSDIAISDSAIHVVWEEDTEPVGSRWNIFYCRGKIIRPPVRGTVISYQPRWNLVSLPVIPESTYQLPSLFAYENQYIAADTMVPGKGYWAKFGWVGESVDYVGVQFYTDTILVNAQWNIVGALSAPLAANEVQSIPSGLVISRFFGYNNCNGYFFADSLYPGMGYWVKASEAGMLIMSSSNDLIENSKNVVASNRVKIIDDGEMPPLPPNGITQERREQHQVTAKEFALHQNYPNPFNPKTIIGFKIQNAGFTTLKVYDIFGRELATLVNEKMEAGEHEVELNAEGFSSGVYFYRLHTQMFTETKKLLLIR